jgi:hypothetical protein
MLQSSYAVFQTENAIMEATTITYTPVAVPPMPVRVGIIYSLNNSNCTVFHGRKYFEKCSRVANRCYNH